MGISLSKGISIESPKSSLRRVQVRALTASGSLKLRLRSRDKDQVISMYHWAALAPLPYQAATLATQCPFEFPNVQHSAQQQTHRGAGHLQSL